MSNLKKVVESIIDYYMEVLNITLNSDFTRPDVMKIAEKYDKAELGHLLQMILGKNKQFASKYKWVFVKI